MSYYQAFDITDSIKTTMKNLSKATRGMPGRDRFRPAFSRVRRSGAILALNIEEGSDYFTAEPAKKTAKKTASKTASKSTTK